MKAEDIHCIEEFLNVKMNNIDHLTTEQVDGKPIKDKTGRRIGTLTDADEDFIYGVIYDGFPLYEEPETISFEIVEK